jgi:hypothetical protein
MAAYATVFRRLVTDPVSGHLLDYGTRAYLPAPLRTFVAARDDVCRAPDCGVHDERRLQMDHARPFPVGGSDAANAGMLSTTCHQLKTAGLVDVVDGASDGSATWFTAWGQRVHLPPRPVIPGLDPPAEVVASTAAGTRPDRPPGRPPTCAPGAFDSSRRLGVDPDELPPF